MALHVPRAPGFASMMKDGARFFSGLEEAVIRNIGACKEFAETVQTCYGPNGMNKMVINHLEKLFVTNDAATIIRYPPIECKVSSNRYLPTYLGTFLVFCDYRTGIMYTYLISIVFKIQKIIKGVQGCPSFWFSKP